MRCLILGGKGFIGSHLADALLDRGHSVRVFDRAQPPDTDLPVMNNLECIEGDFANAADIAKVSKDIDICFHLVSTTLPATSNDNPVFDVETNLIGTLHLLRCAVENSFRKIVFISSGGTVYGVPEYLPLDEKHPTNPICSYGIVKLAIEKYLEMYRQLHGLDYQVLRLSNPYGPKQRQFAAQGAVAVFLGKILREKEICIWGDGSVTRDYIHIDDVTRAIVRAMEYKGSERVLNIGSGTGASINQLIEALEQQTGKTARTKYTPSRKFDVPSSVLSTELAQQEMEWEPKVPLSEGLSRLVELLSGGGR